MSCGRRNATANAPSASAPRHSDSLAEIVPVDVRVFFGHKPGKPVVAIQVFTLRGKLPHLNEQIRRSWNNVRHLK